MADDPDIEDEDGEFELEWVPHSAAAVVEFEESSVVFPEGYAAFAAQVGAIALHVESDGTIWGLDAESRQWRNTELPESTLTALPAVGTRQ